MSGKPVLTWILLGTGAMLIYSAVKRKSPLDVISDAMGGQHAKPSSGGATDSFTGTGSVAPLDTSGTQLGSVAKALAFANAHVGDPYVAGANGPHAWDCSSYVQAAMAAAGVQIPRVTFDQVKQGQPESYANMRPGDLIFTKGLNESGDWVDYGHVGIYMGGGLWAEAPHSGAKVYVTKAPDVNSAQAIRRYINSAVQLPNPFARS